MSGDHHSESIMPNSDSIAMCYQDASEVIATADVDNDKSDSNQIIINFAEFTASEGDDYYGHVLASTFSLFQQHVSYYCEPSQSTNAGVSIEVSIKLESVDLPGVTIAASPESKLSLRLDVIQNDVSDTFEGVIFESFQQETPRSADFYFRDVPAGRYRLSFVLDVAALAEATCLDTADNYQDSFSIGEAVLGQRLFSLEKVNLAEQFECQPTIGQRREVCFKTTR